MPVRETVTPKRGSKGTKFPSKWVMVDLDGKVLGRAAAHVASLLRGKTKPTFSPSVAAGEFVVAVNAEKVRFTGQKIEKKIYRHHTGYYGHVKSETARHRIARSPAELFRDTVRGMLPHTKLGRALIGRLKVYAGPKHPHAAQAPEVVSVDGSKE